MSHILTRSRRSLYYGLMLVAVLAVSGAAYAYASSFSGNYTQQVTNTTTSSPDFAIAGVSDSLDGSCSYASTSATCQAASLAVGSSYTISVTIENTGTGAGPVSVTASTGSGGSVDSISPSSTSQTIDAGSSYTFTLTVTSNGAGTDSVSISFTG